MNRKKPLALLAALVFMMALAACDNKKEPDKDPTPTRKRTSRPGSPFPFLPYAISFCLKPFLIKPFPYPEEGKPEDTDSEER